MRITNSIIDCCKITPWIKIFRYVPRHECTRFVQSNGYWTEIYCLSESCWSSNIKHCEQKYACSFSAKANPGSGFRQFKSSTPRGPRRYSKLAKRTSRL